VFLLLTLLFLLVQFALCIDKRDEMVQPRIRHHHIVIQQYPLLAPRHAQASIDRAWKPAIDRVSNDSDRYGRSILDADQLLPGPVGRAIIHEDQLPRRPGISEECPQAMPGEFELVEAGNHDRRQSHDQTLQPENQGSFRSWDKIPILSMFNRPTLRNTMTGSESCRTEHMSDKGQ
jgi:hypothetical protein